MKTHLINCDKTPQSVKERLRAPSEASSVAPATYVASQIPSKSGPCAVDQVTLNLLLVELVVVCALPFSILDSVAFKDFIAKLAPGLKVPPRQYLTHSLLQSATKVMRDRVIAKLNEQKYVSIVTDGWTNPNGGKIVNFMIVAPEMPSMFWSSWAAGSESQTAAKIAEKVKQVADEVQQLTTARVVGVVTDNASNMVGMWGRVSKYAIVGGGCAAHVLNLLMKNLFAHKSLKQVHSNCVQISRFVRDHTALLDTFRVKLNDVRASGLKRSGLTLPVPTRWYSVFNCLENVLANHEELFQLFTSPDHAQLRQTYESTSKSREKLQYMKAIVQDGVFWENLRVVVRMIRPIRNAMGGLESDKEFASGVYSWFRKLLRHEMYWPRGHDRASPVAVAEVNADAAVDTVDADDEPPEPSYSRGYVPSTRIDQVELTSFFRDKIKKRWAYVHTNAMAIAFYLDPRYKFTDFEPGDERRTRAIRWPSLPLTWVLLPKTKKTS